MGKFAIDLTKAIEKTKGDIDGVVQKVTIDLFNHVIMRTPVDTGRARGAWQVGWNQIPSQKVDREDNQSPVTQDGSGSSSTKDIAEKFVTGSTKSGGIVYLVNNMSYIRVLEYGRGDGKPGSYQSPQGMVRITLTEFQNNFSNTAIGIKK